jgi:hypothetical protein
MHDLLVAVGFLAMVLAPCLIATFSGSTNEA